MNIKSFIRLALLAAILLPSMAFALLPAPISSYTSGFYVGAQAGYAFVTDKAEFDATNPHPSDGSTNLSSRNTNLHSVIGGIYAGYGYLFNHGNIPYLGAELGLHYRSEYNSCSGLSNGCLYGKTINAQYALSADVMPGYFFDDDKTTLVYGRLGVEGDRFKLKGDGLSDHQYEFMFRAGAGVEHQLVNGVYARLDYVFSIAPNKITFHAYRPVYDDNFYSTPYFHNITLGLNYKFNG